MTSILPDQQYQNVEFKSLSNCKSQGKTKIFTTCDLQTVDFMAQTAHFNTVKTRNIVVANISDPNVRLDSNVEFTDMLAIDSLSGAQANNEVQWVLESVYVQTNNAWTNLNITPVSSGFIPTSSLTSYPPPMNELIVEYITWLQNAFQVSGVHNSHGFTVFPNSKYIPSLSFNSPRFRIGALAHLPSNERILNWVIVVRRTTKDILGAVVDDVYYTMTLEATVNGGASGSGLFVGMIQPSGLPDNPAFWTGQNVAANYQNPDHTEYALYFSI